MSTMPPEQPAGTPPPPPVHAAGYPGLGGGVQTGAVLPIPGNAEFLLYVVVEIVLAIVAAVANDFDSHGWAIATTWITAAYLISRGIAKASRVLEQ
ncbi:MAG: hypothetical protein ABR569_12055 [Gaiellaceae bacterium]